MAQRDLGRLVAAALGGWYLLVTLAELLLRLTVEGHALMAPSSRAILLEYAQPHNALHVLIVVGLAVGVLGPPRLRAWLLVVLAVSFAVVNVQSLLDPQAAGEQLGHAGGLPLSYRINNAVILILATFGAWQAWLAVRRAPAVAS